MNIRVTEEIEAFLRRCEYNIVNDYKNEFLGALVTKENEYEIQCAMRDAGFSEFQGDESSWPSLFIETEKYLSSPYQSTIRLDHIATEEFHFTMEEMPANELFHVGSVIFDENRELNESMMLRALDHSYMATVLWQGDDIWMLDSPSEANTIDPIAQKAFGNVLTFGLGIGYFIFMAMRNPKVTSITVVEQSASVIDMFQRFLLPQFPKHVPVTFIQGDAFAYFNKEFIDRFDYVFADIWKSNEDGFSCIAKMLEQYQPPMAKEDFWIETSCFEHLPSVVYLYYQALIRGQEARHDDPFLDLSLKKAAKYFSTIDETIDSAERLKHYMYDREVLRKIAGTSI